jgi:hypothetical protein
MISGTGSTNLTGSDLGRISGLEGSRQGQRESATDLIIHGSSILDSHVQGKKPGCGASVEMAPRDGLEPPT